MKSNPNSDINEIKKCYSFVYFLLLFLILFLLACKICASKPLHTYSGCALLGNILRGDEQGSLGALDKFNYYIIFCHVPTTTTNLNVKYCYT